MKAYRSQRRWWLVLALVPLAAGCGSSVSQDELDRATRAVEAGLEVWKKGEPMARLKTLSPPVELYDDSWTKGTRLVDFKILKTEGKPETPLRCTVSMTLRERNGKTVQRETVYEVKSGPTMIVARDPYF